MKLCNYKGNCNGDYGYGNLLDNEGRNNGRNLIGMPVLSVWYELGQFQYKHTKQISPTISPSLTQLS